MLTPQGVLTYDAANVYVLTKFSGTAPAANAEITGPDGTIWFSSSSALYHVVNRAVVATYPAPTNVVINDVIFGDDGSLWFCGYVNGIPNNAQNVTIIGRVTQSGAYTIVPLPQSQTATLISIASARRNGVYVMSDGVNNAVVVYSTSSGTATTYRLQLPAGATLNSVRVAPDGTAWYTTSTPNTIGYFTLP